MIKDFIEINLNDYKNELIPVDTINHDLEVNPFGKYLLFIEENEIVGFIYYSDIYDRAEINQIEVLVSHRNC